MTQVETSVSIPAGLGGCEDGRGERANVLLVDDNPANLLTLRTILAELDENLFVAGSGEDALRELLRADFAVVVLDVNMPVLDGFETARLIRGRRRSAHTPIIFISAVSLGDAHAYRGYSIGGVDYIFAPIVPEVLRSKVRVFVQLYKQRLEVQRQAELLRAAQDREHRRRLVESDERLALALRAGRMGVWELDLAGRRMSWSVPADGVAAVPQPEWETLDGFLGDVAEEQREAVASAIARAASEACDLQVEPRVGGAYGQAGWIELRGRLVRDDAGRPERLVGVYLDTSARKRVEEELRQARDSAHEANRVKDRFLAMLSHELRTPLTPALMMASSWSRRADVPEPLRRDLELICKSIETESRLIDDLLDLTHISRGAIELRPRPIDLHDVIDAAVRVQGAEQSAARRVELRYLREAEVSGVHGDPTRLQQVVWNLVSNALKYTPPGGRVQVRTHNDSSGTITLTVADNGIGIQPDYLPRIFAPFERGDPSVSARISGLGLGLAICKTIVELHDGTIEAESEGAGKGATFRVRLPVAVARRSETQDAQDAPPAVAGLRLLVVEDHPGTADVLARLLRLSGHQVRVAACVAEALATADAWNFDLLISDMALPDGNGIALLGEIRRRRPVPAIALSGHGTREDVELARAAGFSEHLTKPIDARELDETIARLFAERAESAGDDLFPSAR